MKKAKRQLNGPRCQGRPQQPLPHGSAHGSPHGLSHEPQLRQLALPHGRPHSAQQPSSQQPESQPVVHRAQPARGPDDAQAPTSVHSPHRMCCHTSHSRSFHNRRTGGNRRPPGIGRSRCWQLVNPRQTGKYDPFHDCFPTGEAKSRLSTGVIVRTIGRIEKIVRIEMVGVIVLCCPFSLCQLFPLSLSLRILDLANRGFKAGPTSAGTVPVMITNESAILPLSCTK